MSVCGGRFRRRWGEESLGDFLGRLSAHVEESDAGVGQVGSGLFEEAADDSRVAGDDLESGGGGFLAEFGEAGIAMGGKFAEVGDGFEAFAAGGELLEDSVFDAIGDDLGVGAAAVEDLGVFRHGRNGREMMERERGDRKRGFDQSAGREGGG